MSDTLRRLGNGRRSNPILVVIGKSISINTPIHRGAAGEKKLSRSWWVHCLSNAAVAVYSNSHTKVPITKFLNLDYWKGFQQWLKFLFYNGTMQKKKRMRFDKRTWRE
ncbi:MAG: hypothetical protein ABI723_24915 [Bacteroidia bacterium]